MSEDALLEEDIWEYKSVRKQKHEGHSESISVPTHKVSNGKGRTKRKRNNKKSTEEKTDVLEQSEQSSRPNQDADEGKDDSSVHSQESQSSQKEQSSEGVKPIYDGYCPSCQMPFALLLVQTPRWHVAECLDTPGSTEKECPDGLLCTSTIPSHYKRYNHFLLAASRAGDYLVNSSMNTLERNMTYNTAAKPSSSPSHVEEASQDEKPCSNMKNVPNDDCTLVVQSLPQMKLLNIVSETTSSFTDAQKPQVTCQLTEMTDNSCKFEFYDFASSQGSRTGDHFSQKDASQPSLLQSVAYFSDCEISYSPLSNFEESEVETEEEENKVKISQKKLIEDQNGTVSQSHISSKSCHSACVDNQHQQEVLTRVSSFPFNCKDAKHTEFISSAVKASNTESEDTGAHTSDSANMNFTETSSLLLREGAASVRTQKTNVFEDPSNFLINTGKMTANAIEKMACQDSLQSVVGKEVNLKTAAVCLPSPVSKTASSLSVMSMNVKSSSAKELKQMDIGVFFGLKPKLKEESKGESNLSKGKQVSSSVTPEGKRPRQQKRKAEGSVEDVEEVTENSTKNGAFTEVSAGGQRRWRKRFRELPPTGEGTGKKHCPFYKKIPGTGFAVDAFQYGEIEGCTAYFLTHFHSDHYCGLTKNFAFPIYCNKITGNLVKSKLRVKEQFIHILPMDTECTVNGIKVLLLDANHCPGATMILFHLPNGNVILHTGDFRADPFMERYPALIGQRVHTLYLDTTYCSPEYTFPPQQEVIQFAVNTAFETVTLNPRTLVVCGTYSIGKEKVFLGMLMIYLTELKYTLFFSQGLQDHLNKFSENFDQVLAFKPTGWTYSDSSLSLLDIKPQTRGKITIYGIPYSEHSSYLEIKRFVQWLKPQKIIPTVNVGDWRARSLMEKHFRDWMIESSQHK
ncbi:DCR1A protein, partial [Turnix velox]|nr:DCR1A protein [Turnix velox]